MNEIYNPFLAGLYILFLRKDGNVITTGAPLYYKVYNALRNKIEAGEFSKGDLLPTELELENLFKVSRITIRKAIEMLSNEGFVATRQGKGTEVLDPKTTQKLNSVTSFSETLLEKGYNVSSKNVQIELIKPPGRVASELKIDLDTEVVRVYRIRLANDKPIAIMINYLRAEMVPGIESKINMADSLYRFLETEYNIVFDSAVENIGARAAGTTEAEMLQIPEGAPLITSRRVTSADGKPIEVVVSSIVADKYEYKVFLKGRPA